MIAKSPCDGLLPVEIGGVTLREVDLGHLTALAPHRGKEKSFAEAMKAAHGLTLPKPGRATGKDGKRLIWFGRAHVLLAGPAPAARLLSHAAVTDQSDAWAALRIEGEGVEDVLARLVPIDLRQQVFKRGHTARTQLQHMNVSITRLGDDAFMILGFRSMATTLVHELETAMSGVAARRAG
nr:sarcosine oxidase subunit gamma [Shimia biformata]